MTEIVAEISGNHGGSLDNACRLIHEAKVAGADAVKFQCFEPERLAARRGNLSWHGNELVYDDLLVLYRKTHTPKDWFPTIIAKAEIENIPWFSSVFDQADVAFLETLDCPRYKISQYEDSDWQLLKAVIETGKPYIRSVKSRPGLMILRATGYGLDKDLSIGLSDHSKDGVYPLGLSMVERHLCLPDVETPDSEFSSTPEQFAAYVKAIRRAAA